MTDVEIAVTTSPGGISLASEIRLLKPALLYGDHVTIYSGSAALLQAAVGVGLSKEATLELMRHVAPMLDPNSVHALAEYDRLRAKRHRTRADLQNLFKFERLLTDGARGILEVAEGLVAQAGGAELVPAIEAGLVTIDPLVRDDVDPDDADALFNGYLDRLKALLRDGHAYPLFDEQVCDLVRAGLDEDAFELGATAKRHGKQVSAAAQFMERLPVFPNASISEVLSIREELRSPLVRFRAAIIEMERLIDAAAHEPDFAAEVGDLYLEKIAPALSEIAELVRDNASLRQLTGAAVAEAKTIAAAVLTVAVTSYSHIPGLAAAALDIGVPGVAAAASAAWARSQGARGIERHQLFFLYRLEQSLAAN